MTLRTARPTFAQNLSTDGVRRLVASYQKSADGAIIDDFKLRSGFLYTQVRAISARVNQNYDGWPSTELKKSYRSFLGKPVFVNHQNFDPSKARGRVVAARYVESGNDKFIEVIQEIDAHRFPKLASEIRTGGLDSVSMGVEAGFTKCSVCDNKATDLHDMCDHVKFHKGKHLPHAKTGKRTLVFENCYKLGFFELSYVFDPADETAVVSKVLVANRRHAYGETEAPEDVDTLRNSRDENDQFHHYVESPQELRKPNMDSTIRNDLQQEEEGLDSERRAEDVEELNPADGGKKIVEPDVAHEDVIDDFLDWCDSINVQPGQDALNDFSNAYRLNNEDYDAVSQFLESAEGNGAGTTTSNANQPVPHMSRRKMATYRYAEEGFGEPDGDEGYEDEGFEPGAPPHDHDGDGDIDYEGEQEGPDEELIQAFVSWCEENGVGPDEQSLDAFAQEAQLEEEDYQALSELIGGGEEEEGYPEEGGEEEFDPSMMGGGDPSMMGGDPSMMDPSLQMQARRSTGKNNTSSQKKRRATEGKSMARETLASRGKKAASRQRLHRLAGEDGHFDSGPYDENNQGEQEEIFLSQTPGTEGLSAPVPGDGTISNTEKNLVARIQAQNASLRRDITAWNNIQRYKQAADGGLPDADTVNPELSGTDEQSLKGQDFERVQPDKVETQSKDASLKAFAAFDNWLRNTTGRTASQHGNANFIRRQATRWAGTYGYPVEVLFPAMGTFLRQARRIEGSSNMRRTADEKLEVAAPQDRIDVEAPVSNTTDADAQASQFDLGDFGGNASDNVADPDLSTGSQIWAPGEGVKESNRKADGVAAIRLAEAYIKAGLKPEGEKYNLVAQFQTMRHATVTDRTRLLEAVLKTASFSRRVTAGTNRGAAPRTAIPRGLMNGGGMSRSASVNRVAANDPSTDSDLFL